MGSPQSKLQIVRGGIKCGISTCYLPYTIYFWRPLLGPRLHIHLVYIRVLFCDCTLGDWDPLPRPDLKTIRSQCVFGYHWRFGEKSRSGFYYITAGIALFFKCCFLSGCRCVTELAGEEEDASQAVLRGAMGHPLDAPQV